MGGPSGVGVGFLCSQPMGSERVSSSITKSSWICFFHQVQGGFHRSLVFDPGPLKLPFEDIVCTIKLATNSNVLLNPYKRLWFHLIASSNYMVASYIYPCVHLWEPWASRSASARASSPPRGGNNLQLLSWNRDLIEIRHTHLSTSMKRTTPSVAG